MTRLFYSRALLETLELLEELLVEYKGTVLLVSHDRSFLNNVVTSTLAMEGNGVVREYPGGYDDWLSQRIVKRETAAAKTPASNGPRAAKQVQGPLKFSPADQRELANLLKKIETVEAGQEELYKLMAEPGFYQKDPKEISRIKMQAEAYSAELAQMYGRWEALEKLKNNPA